VVRWLLVSWPTGLAGCAIASALSPIPDMRTPTDHAREISARCKGVTEESSAPMLAPDAIDSVEPDYSVVPSGNAQATHMLGARIHIRPLPALTKESLERTLLCHEAHVMLDGAKSPENDPYVLPLRWLDIDVASEQAGFVARVETNANEDAHRALERARLYARAAR
jgi:hypothetical protein